MIDKLPRWANYSIIVILVFGILAMFIFALDSRLDQQTFIKKFDQRIKVTDKRFAEEKSADADRSMKVDALLNETTHVVHDLVYIIQVRLSNHTIHTDRELGDLNGNLTKLLKENRDLLIDINDTD